MCRVDFALSQAGPHGTIPLMSILNSVAGYRSLFCPFSLYA